MGTYETLGSALAGVRRALAKRLGVNVGFSHRGAAAVTLRARVLEDGLVLSEQGGALVEERFVTLQVPTGQTGFAAPVDDTEPVTPGDSFTYLSRAYHVVPPVRKDRSQH